MEQGYNNQSFFLCVMILFSDRLDIICLASTGSGMDIKTEVLKNSKISN